MVKLRGIDIRVVSQFDIRRLPEFGYSDPTTAGRQVVCYIPVYPGSQIWFEYSIDGPHPPKAAYFFKLFINGTAITSWDCTAKHGYYGKTIYSLHQTSSGYEIQRSAFRFLNHEEEESSTIKTSNDCIEIRVHRIEHRQRIRSYPNNVDALHLANGSAGKLRLVRGGVLELGTPHKRYKYQLLDAVDEPYATFRFYYRNYEWLEKNGLISSHLTTSHSTVSSSIIWHDPDSSPVKRELERDDSSVHFQVSHPASSAPPVQVVTGNIEEDPTTNLFQSRLASRAREQDTRNALGSSSYLSLSDSVESLSFVTKDSVEDLTSRVPRSPQLSRVPRSNLRIGDVAPASPSSSPRPARSQRRPKLVLDLTGGLTSTSSKTRPLSPFTSSGRLRRPFDPTPSSAPATVTRFGPTIAEEAARTMQADKEELRIKEKQSQDTGWQKSTRTARSGHTLMNLLGRRTDRHPRVAEQV